MSTISTTKRYRIAVATLGRFHVLDLARELAALGHDVRFYSYVPRERAASFGLPPTCHVSLLPWVLPGLLLQKVPARWSRHAAERITHTVADAVVCEKLLPCDYFICMSGVYVEAAKFAKSRFGATVILERGSRHIHSQDAILQSVPGARRPSASAIAREVAGYHLADRISVPATHAAQSFVGYDYQSKVVVNAYGVELRDFRLLKGSSDRMRNVIFVGSWGYQKGADVLGRAMDLDVSYNLLHVGTRGDLPYPTSNRFASAGFVTQKELPLQYARASVLVLPSRQEGLSLVQLQALACGLPIVCTEMTGGADLRQYTEHPEAIVEVPSNDVEALVDGIKVARAIAAKLRGVDLLGASGRASLSWRAYAQRYEKLLLSSGH